MAAAVLLKERGRHQKEGSRYSQSHCFSGKLYCGQCGSRLVARTKKKDAKTYLYWQCYEKAKRGKAACDSPTLSQVYLEQIILQAMGAAIAQVGRDSVGRKRMATFYGGIEQVLGQADGSSRQQEQWQQQLSRLEREQQKLLRLYLQAQVSEGIFLRENAVYEEKIEKLQAKIKVLPSVESGCNQDKMDKMAQIIHDCEMILAGEIFRADFYRQILEKVVVESKERMRICFAGLPYEIQYQAGVD